MKNILAIGAHPDDIEISCLGYLLKENIEKKSKISVFIVSSGALNDPTSGLNRIEESKEALKYINDLNFNYIGNKGIKVSDYEKLSNKIRSLILNINPDEILVHDPNDTNQEHSLVYDMVKTASRRLALNLIRYRSISSLNDIKSFPCSYKIRQNDNTPHLIFKYSANMTTQIQNGIRRKLHT